MGKEECVIGRESWDEGGDRDEREMIGREEASKGKSVGKGLEEDERAAGGAGSMTARSSLKLRSHSSPSSKATPQIFDHTVVPLSTELHPDVASDEAMRRERWVRRRG